jgi:uncharacterized protein YukE
MKKLACLLFMITVSLLVAGCFEQDLEFKIRYQTVDGLKKGASLIHDNQVIGTVNDVIYTDKGDFEVQVTVTEPHVGLATDSTLFFIANAPNGKDERIIRLVEDDILGTPLKAGQTVEGSTALSGIAKDFQNQIDSTLLSLSSSIDRIWSEWQEQTSEEHFARLENELDQLIEEAKTLGDKANSRLKNDIVPKIRQQIDMLKQHLDELGNDQSIDQIEQKMERLDDALEA